MSKIVLSHRNARLVFLALVTLTAALLSWTATAHAQTSRGAQYDSPTATGQAAIAASDLSSARAGSAGVSSSATGVRNGLTGVLPSTGGPLVQLIAVGAIALSSTGLLVLRHNSRR